MSLVNFQSLAHMRNVSRLEEFWPVGVLPFFQSAKILVLGTRITGQLNMRLQSEIRKFALLLP